MKGLKIANIILFSLICVLEAVILYFFVETLITLFSGNVAGILVSILFFFPYFLLLCLGLLVLNIVITITTNIKVGKEREQSLPKTKFDHLCIILPWVFLVLDVVLFITLFVIANIHNSKAS